MESSPALAPGGFGTTPDIRGRNPSRRDFARQDRPPAAPPRSPAGDADRATGCAPDLAAASTGNDAHELLAIFAHEVRSHLAPVRIACALLQRAVRDEATTKRMCEGIDREVEAMARLVGELLDGARARNGKLELHRRETPLAHILARSAELVAPVVAARRQVLRLDAGADALSVEADELWLTHALHNVIGNAAKYSDPGSRIDVCVTRDGQYAVIHVCDTGIGIAPDQLEAIFDVYAQAAQSPDHSVAEGLGVGLYLARSLIERHGGAIRATSEGLGRGSTFIIRIPCVRPSARRIAAPD